MTVRIDTETEDHSNKISVDFVLDLERELERIGRKIDEKREYTRYGIHEESGEERDQPH